VNTAVYIFFSLHARWIFSDNIIRASSALLSGRPPASQSILRNIGRWYERGESEFRAKNHETAWTLLEKAYSELEKTYPELKERVAHFHNWDNLLNLLIACQCDLRKFDEAENILNALLQKIECTLVTETLIYAICQAAEILVSKYYFVEYLGDAASVAPKVIDIKRSNQIDAFDTQRLLAEIYFRQNNHKEAENQCLKIIAARDPIEREQIDNDADLLLAVIYYQTGNMQEARCKKELLPDTYKSKKYP
jgi:tetratricopeptide (TPR) repeat protein